MNGDDGDKCEQHNRDRLEKEQHCPSSRLPYLSMCREHAHRNLPQLPSKRPGSADSPDLPEKMELVSDGTSNTPTVNVMRIITA